MEIIIEEISRTKKLIGRHKFLQQELTLGRGYQNDVILSDPHVCPDHLSLTFEDGDWYITDLDTVNGSFLNHQCKLAERHKVTSGDVISIGKSQVRLILPEHEIAPTLRFSPFDDILKVCAQPAIVLFNVLLFAAVVGVMVYFNTPTTFMISQALVPALGLTLGICLWPLLFALLAHLTKHEARIFTQIGVTFVIINLFWLLDISEVFLDFNVSSQINLNWLFVPLNFALIYLLFWCNLYVAFNQPRKRRLIIATSLSGLLIVGSYLLQMSKEPEFDYSPHYSTTLLSPAFRIMPSNDVDRFLEKSEKLFNKNLKQVAKQED